MLCVLHRGFGLLCHQIGLCWSIFFNQWSSSNNDGFYLDFQILLNFIMLILNYFNIKHIHFKKCIPGTKYGFFWKRGGDRLIQKIMKSYNYFFFLHRKTHSICNLKKNLLLFCVITFCFEHKIYLWNLKYCFYINDLRWRV